MTITDPDGSPAAVDCRPATNKKGFPWESEGRRNLACAGTNRGNGGIAPPSFYERRYGTVDVNAHDKNYRNHWERCLQHLFLTGAIKPICYAVGMALVSVSDKKCKAVWPGYKYLGKLVNRCPRTIATYLHELREFGLLDWDHRRKMTKAGEWDNAVSNITVFTLPVEVCRELGIRRSMWETVEEAEQRLDQRRDVARAALDERRVKAAQFAQSIAELGDIDFHACVAMLQDNFGSNAGVYEYAYDIFKTAWSDRFYPKA